MCGCIQLVHNILYSVLLLNQLYFYAMFCRIFINNFWRSADWTDCPIQLPNSMYIINKIWYVPALDWMSLKLWSIFMLRLRLHSTQTKGPGITRNNRTAINMSRLSAQHNRHSTDSREWTVNLQYQQRTRGGYSWNPGDPHNAINTFPRDCSWSRPGEQWKHTWLLFDVTTSRFALDLGPMVALHINVQ